MSLHLLVIEGNTREDRDAYRAALGMTASEAYAANSDATCAGRDLPNRLPRRRRRRPARRGGARGL